MHRYTVELRVSGKKLDISEVSAALRLQPTNTRIEGEKLSKTKVVQESIWGYDLYPTPAKEDWESLEAALNAVLSKFRARKAELRKLSRRYGVYLWCGHFTSSFNGGPELSPKLLRGLANLGVRVIIDTHSSKESGAVSES
jgi:hypothetical protein